MEKKKIKTVTKLIFHFNTFPCKPIVMQLCLQVKLVLFLWLETAVCNKEGQHLTLQQIIIFFSMDVLFVKFHCLHSTSHFFC